MINLSSVICWKLELKEEVPAWRKEVNSIGVSWLSVSDYDPAKDYNSSLRWDQERLATQWH
jgi:hypothetical protein